MIVHSPEKGFARKARDGSVVHVAGRWFAAYPALVRHRNGRIRLLFRRRRRLFPTSFREVVAEAAAVADAAVAAHPATLIGLESECALALTLILKLLLLLLPKELLLSHQHLLLEMVQCLVMLLLMLLFLCLSVPEVLLLMLVRRYPRGRAHDAPARGYRRSER